MKKPFTIIISTVVIIFIIFSLPIYLVIKKQNSSFNDLLKDNQAKDRSIRDIEKQVQELAAKNMADDNAIKTYKSDRFKYRFEYPVKNFYYETWDDQPLQLYPTDPSIPKGVGESSLVQIKVYEQPNPDTRFPGEYYDASEEYKSPSLTFRKYIDDYVEGYLVEKDGKIYEISIVEKKAAQTFHFKDDFKKILNSFHFID